MDFEKLKLPEAIFRPAPFWSWNEKLDEQELERQIVQMSEKGWGGFFMHSRVGLVTGYLSDEWMNMVTACAKKARETGTYAWLYDEDKWPSGFAGGKVAENKDFRSRALVLLKTDEISDNDQILDTYIHDNVSYSICKRISALGNQWFNGMSYVDLMNPDAVEAFIESTHEKYKNTCGEYFGKEIPGIFTDEPCYLMAGQYNVPVLPWSDYLPDFFKQLKGYELASCLKELFFDVGDYKKVRFDFFDSATQLFIESFTKKYYEWCEKNNLKMTGHFMAEDTLISQTSWIGAAMPHYQYMHWPGIDKLGRHLKQVVTVKQVTSVADQLNKERSFCEVFGCVGQHVSFFHRKWIADWQAVLGISFVNHHLSLYSMRGERKRDYPANLFYQQPWWDNEAGFSDYIGRLSYMITQGKRKVDILVIHPIASAWSTYSPTEKKLSMIYSKGGSDEFDRLAEKLLDNKLDYHFGDEIIMKEHACAKNNKMNVGRHQYSTIIVPPMETLRKSTLDLLIDFSDKGDIIMLKPYPERIDGIKTKIKWPESIKWADSLGKAIEMLEDKYSDRIKITDTLTGNNAGKIILHHRICDTGEMLLLANTDDKRDIHAQITIPGKHNLVTLDLCSGNIYELPHTYEDGYTKTNAHFQPAGSIAVFMDVNVPGIKQAPAVLDSGICLKNIPAAGKTIENWNTLIQEENVLPINDATLYLNNEKVADSQPLAKIWHNFFYSAKNGTPFTAEYSFNVINIPESEVFAVIENAENLDSISINGNEATALKAFGEMGPFNSSKSWKDISFTKVPLTGYLKKGLNKIKVSGKKVNNITGPGTHVSVENFNSHNATEVEVIYIVGNFSLINENNKFFSIDGGSSKPCFKDITHSGYPFYSGSIVLTSAFTVDNSGGKILLTLNNVKAACASVKVNDTEIGVKYWDPFVYDISDAVMCGENKISVTLDTTLFNVMGPNRHRDIPEVEYVSPQTFISLDQMGEKYKLLPFGMDNASICHKP